MFNTLVMFITDLILTKCREYKKSDLSAFVHSQISVNGEPCYLNIFFHQNHVHAPLTITYIISKVWGSIYLPTGIKLRNFSFSWEQTTEKVVISPAGIRLMLLGLHTGINPPGIGLMITTIGHFGFLSLWNQSTPLHLVCNISRLALRIRIMLYIILEWEAPRCHLC